MILESCDFGKRYLQVPEKTGAGIFQYGCRQRLKEAVVCVSRKKEGVRYVGPERE